MRTGSPAPPSLTAADAEWLMAVAAQKRQAAAEAAGADPGWVAQMGAEAAGLHKYRMGWHLNPCALPKATRTASTAGRLPGVF